VGPLVLSGGLVVAVQRDSTVSLVGEVIDASISDPVEVIEPPGKWQTWTQCPKIPLAENSTHLSRFAEHSRQQDRPAVHPPDLFKGDVVLREGVLLARVRSLVANHVVDAVPPGQQATANGRAGMPVHVKSGQADVLACKAIQLGSLYLITPKILHVAVYGRRSG